MLDFEEEDISKEEGKQEIIENFDKFASRKISFTEKRFEQDRYALKIISIFRLNRGRTFISR